MPEPGTYVLAISGPGSLRRTVVVGEGQDLDLGALRLVVGAGLLAPTSSLTAVTDQVLPGGLAQLRAVVDFPVARTGSARLALPAGTTVPQGGVLLDGVVVPFTVEAADTGSTLVVPFPSGTSRTLRIHVTTPQRAGQSLPFALTVATAGSSEPLGTVVVRVGMVSLEVPEASADGTVVVNGFAPAGARVEVREADRVVVEAVAGVGGRWQATADLGSPGGDRVRHWLSARSTVGSLELQLGLRSVVVDAYATGWTR